MITIMKSFAVLLSVAIILTLITQIYSISSDAYEWCLDGRHHKKKPGKESLLYHQCDPWKHHSCCTQNTSQTANAQLNHYKFNYDHCKQMSPQCKRHFIQDLCFYECEPNLKLWIVKTNRSYARERIFKVPLCASQCQQWWSDCQQDYTCAYDWQNDFKWINATNVCKPGSQCKPFYKMYKNAKEFCEKVWDDSYEYTDNEHCMKLWFDGRHENPNKEVAIWFATQLNSSNNLLPHVGLILYFILFVNIVII